MWPDSSETQQLLKRAVDGDPQAINGLLERHRDALRRMVGMRMDPVIASRLDASDVVQDVLVDANRRLPDYLEAPRLPFHLWLRQIAKDRLIDAHRRHRLATRRSVDRERSLSPTYDDQSAIDLLAQLQDREATPCAIATRAEMRRRFEAAIEKLDETDREVILMRHFEDLSNQEVAQALGLSDAASGMRYLRALRRLRAMFDEVPS